MAPPDRTADADPDGNLDASAGATDPGTESADASLPHERDEGAEELLDDPHHRANRRVTDQARRDVEGGIVDTERIGIPNDVPVAKKSPNR